MSKYVIIAANKDKSGNVIDVKLLTYGKMSKSNVIESLKNGNVFYSETYNGPEVHLVNEKYIRTDKNNTSKDNLDNLPPF